MDLVKYGLAKNNSNPHLTLKRNPLSFDKIRSEFPLPKL